jgi:hypothetical protein
MDAYLQPQRTRKVERIAVAAISQRRSPLAMSTAAFRRYGGHASCQAGGPVTETHNSVELPDADHY